MSRLIRAACRHLEIRVKCATHGVITLTPEEKWAQLFAPFPGPFCCPQCPAPDALTGHPPEEK